MLTSESNAYIERISPFLILTHLRLRQHIARSSVLSVCPVFVLVGDRLEQGLWLLKLGCGLHCSVVYCHMMRMVGLAKAYFSSVNYSTNGMSWILANISYGDHINTVYKWYTFVFSH